MIDKMLNQILLPLADQYESGLSKHCVTLEPGTPEEFEPFRELMATLRAEGSVIMSPHKTYQMTPSGYAKYIDRIKALRVLA
jgi:hypothetical protein